MKPALAFVAVVLVGFASASNLLAQNPVLGTWKLNVAKSNYNPGPAPKSMTRTVESAGDQVKYTFVGVAADGSPVSYTFTVAFDGKDHPITGPGPGGADAISAKQSGPRSTEATFKKSGQPVLISKVQSKSVRRRQSHHHHQTNAPGAGSVNNTLVYEKQ